MENPASEQTEQFLSFRLRCGGWVDHFQLRQAAIEAARLCWARGEGVELVEIRSEYGEEFELPVVWKTAT